MRVGLLTGGGDVQPSRYGARPIAETHNVDPMRDAFEIRLIRAAIEADMPLLATCRGMQVLNVAMGGSLVDNDSMEIAKRITNVTLPVDVVVGDDLANPTEIETVEVANGLSAGQKAFDIGPKTIAAYDDALKNAKTIFWNGPMGVFEKEAFAKGTMAMAKSVAGADAITVVGGGESVEAVKASGYADRISHISTGGGASLEFISGKTLPGVEVLRN